MPRYTEYDPAPAPLSGAEVLLLVQGGDSYRVTLASLLAPASFCGVGGTVSSDPADGTGWTTIGAVHINPAGVLGASGAAWSLHADLEVAEASASTVQAEVRLLDSSNTSLGSVSSTLGAASAYPEHVSTSLTKGEDPGELRPTATTYLIQMRRQGGSPGDLAICHNAYINISWSLAMPLPPLEKTWQFDCDNFEAAQGSATLCNNNLYLKLKTALIGFGSSPWTVVLSSNAVVANASDNWNSVSDLVNHGTTRSWIVLRQTGIAANFEVCIDLNSTTASVGTIVVSKAAGFTGGTTTARPTATDEQVAVSTNTILSNSLNAGIRWSVLQTTDGSLTHLIAATAGSVALQAFFGKPADVVSGWTDPSFCHWSVSLPGLSTFYNNVGFYSARIGTTNAFLTPLVLGNWTGIVPNDSTWANAANQVSNEWPLLPIHLGCVTTPVRGVHARTVDMWATSSGVASGTGFPGDGSRQLLRVGNIVIPWDGGPFNLS